MKNKNVYKSLIIFTFTLLLTVGYAVVSSVTLTISGTAGTGSEILDVSFTGTTEVSDSTKAKASASGITATASISSITLNETVTLEYEISNNETDVDAELVVEIPASTDYFEISASEGAISSGGDVGSHGTPAPASATNEDYKIMQLADSDVGHVGSSSSTTSTTQTYDLPAGETIVIMVSVKMSKTPVEESDSTYDFNFNITANPVTITT